MCAASVAHGGSQPPGYPQAGAWGHQWQQWGQPRQAVRRPGGILAAATMTYIGSGFMALVGIVILLGAALIALAAFTQKGRGGARIGLTVIGAAVVVLDLVSLINGAAQSILAIAYIAVAVILLWVGPANAWYRAQKAARSRGDQHSVRYEPS